MIQKIKSAVQIVAIFCAMWGVRLPHAHAIQITSNPADSSLVDTLNKRAFSSRLKNSKLSLVEAKKSIGLGETTALYQRGSRSLSHDGFSYVLYI